MLNYIICSYISGRNSYTVFLMRENGFHGIINQLRHGTPAFATCNLRKFVTKNRHGKVSVASVTITQKQDPRFSTFA